MYIKKNGLKILKGFHLIFVSITVGGSLVIIILLKLEKSSIDLIGQPILDQVVFKTFELLVNYGFGAILFTGFIYGMFTHWGFFKYYWIMVKWVLVFLFFMASTIWGFSLISGLAATADSGINQLSYLSNDLYRKNTLIFILLFSIVFVGIIFWSSIRPWGKISVFVKLKRWKVLAIGGFLAFLIYYYLLSSSVGLDKYRNMNIEAVNLNFVEDGIYTGQFDEAGGPYIVEVIIKNHQIIDVKPVNSRNSHYAKLAEGIFYQVQERQQINLDGISGATTTSKCYLKAIENALLNNDYNLK